MMSEQKKIGLTLTARSRAWDASAAVGRVRRWAGGPVKENVDFNKYFKAFMWRDGSDPENFGSYKLPYADFVEGRLVAVPRGIFAVAVALNGVDIPESDKATIRNVVSRWYAQMRRAFNDDSIVPPWEKQAQTTAALSEVYLRDHLNIVAGDYFSVTEKEVEELGTNLPEGVEPTMHGGHIVVASGEEQAVIRCQEGEVQARGLAKELIAQKPEAFDVVRVGEAQAYKLEGKPVFREVASYFPEMSGQVIILKGEAEKLKQLVAKGRVLNSKNLKLLEDAVHALNRVLESAKNSPLVPETTAGETGETGLVISEEGVRFVHL